MKLESMREFVSIVTHGSLTKAAKELYISQSTLSAHIAEMERELGFSVFERSSGSKVQLSYAGSLFLESAQGILEAYDDALERGRAASGVAKPLRIGASVFGPELMDALLDISDFEIQLIELDPESVFLETLVKDEADINLLCGYSRSKHLSKRAEEEGIASSQVGTMSITLGLMASHPLAKKTTLSAKDLADYRILVTVPSMHPGWVDAINETLGGAVELQGSIKPWLSSSAELMRQGFGTDLLFSYSGGDLKRLARRGNVVLVDELDGKPIEMPLCAAYRKKDYDWRYEKLIRSLQGIAMTR